MSTMTENISRSTYGSLPKADITSPVNLIESCLDSIANDMTKKVTNLTDWEEDSFINDKINAKKLNKLRKPKFISSCGVLSCFRSKNYVKSLYRKISNTFESYISTSTSQTSPYLTHKVNKLSPMVEKNVMKPKSSLLNKERSLSSFSVDNFEQKGNFNTLHYKTNHTLFHQELNYISPLISETPENMFHQSDLIPDHSSATQTYSLVTQQSISQQQQQQQQPFKINLMEEKRCNSRLLRHFTETLEQNHNIDVGSKHDKSLSCLKMDDYVDGDEVNHIRGSSKQVLQHYNDNIDGNQNENTKNEESSVDNYRSMHHFTESRLHKLVETIFSYENSFHITPKLDFSNNHEQFGSRLSCSMKSYSTERQQENQENKDSYQIQNFDKDIKHWLVEGLTKSVKESNDHKNHTDNHQPKEFLQLNIKTNSHGLKQAVDVKCATTSNDRIANRTFDHSLQPNTTSTITAKQSYRTTKEPQNKPKTSEQKPTYQNSTYSSRGLKTTLHSNLLGYSYLATGESNSHSTPPLTPSRRTNKTLTVKYNGYFPVRSEYNKYQVYKTPESNCTPYEACDSTKKDGKCKTFIQSGRHNNLGVERYSTPFGGKKQPQQKLRGTKSNQNSKHRLTDRNYKSVKKSTKLCRSSPLQNLDKFRTHSENSTPCSSVNTHDLLQLADVSDTFDIRDIKKYVYDESLSGGHHDDGHRNVGHFTNISEASGNGCIGFPLIDQTYDQDNYPLGCSVYPEINNMPYVHSGYYPCIPPPAQPTLLLGNINPTLSNNLNQELVLPFLTSPLFNTPSSVNWTNLSTTVNPYKYDKNTYFYPVYPYYYPVEQFSAARHLYFPVQPYQSLNTTNHNSHSASKQREISNAHKTSDYRKRNKA
ncbi:unnamed protein product [Heterobilharzia americana]|nr:unnamed protein product [Heterobilharzia americana]